MLVPGDTLSINIDCDDFQVAYQHTNKHTDLGDFPGLTHLVCPLGFTN